MSVKVGDIVYLRSGGPKMTIRTVTDEKVTCDWFDKSSVKSRDFSATQLQTEPISELPFFGINVGCGDKCWRTDCEPWLQNKIEPEIGKGLTALRLKYTAK